MDEKVRETVEQLNTLLGESPYKVDVVNPKEVKLLDKNARYMNHEMFQNLVNNVKKDGALTSLPLCYREKGKLIVLSGNHRVKAAVEAGLEHILILVVQKQLTRQEQVAIQLSHNAIEGKDDPIVLKSLWDEIEQIDLKMYAGLSSELIQELEKLEFSTIAEAPPELKQIVLLFLPEEVEKIKALMQEIEIMCSGDEAFLLSVNHYAQVFKLLVDVKEKLGIVSNPVAFMKIISLAQTALNASNIMPEKHTKNTFNSTA